MVAEDDAGEWVKEWVERVSEMMEWGERVGERTCG